jgi:hypothetical protein
MCTHHNLNARPLRHGTQNRRLRHPLRRLRGVGYAAVAVAALVAAGLQPPHAGDVEVGTARVAAAAGDFATWVTTSPVGLR